MSEDPVGAGRVLFICTGNYYRSRFAEAVFNHRAGEWAPGWSAFSRGLAIDAAPDDDLASEVSRALRARGIDPTRDWISCDGDEDLGGALPVWSKHFGHGTPLDRLPDVGKPTPVKEFDSQDISALSWAIGFTASF